MRIAVAGATGSIGARTAATLERDGPEVVRISRSLGIDLPTGEGLDEVLDGVPAVVDAVSSPPISPDDTRDCFATTKRNLLAAEQRAGVGHLRTADDRGDQPDERRHRPLRGQAGTGVPRRARRSAVVDRAGHTGP